MVFITWVFIFIIKLRFPAGTPISAIIKKRYGDHVLKIYRKFENASFKEQKCILDKIFLCECRKNNLVPKFLRIKLCKTERNIKLYKNFQRTLLDNEIKTKTKDIIKLGKVVNQLQAELKQLCSFIDFSHFKSLVGELVSKKITTVKRVHERKLFHLGVVKTEGLNPNNVVFNYSKLRLSERLTFLLSKGLNFAIPTPKLRLPHFLLPFEKLLRHLNNHSPIHSHRSIKFVKSTIRSLAFSTYHSYHPEQHDDVSREDIKLLRELSKRDDIVVCKPDKGQGVVILNKDDYISKMKEILDDKSKFVKINTKDEKLVIKNEDKLNNFLRKLKKGANY